MAIKKRYSTLGRGLDALITSDPVVTAGSGSISEVPVRLVRPNPDQPRHDFDETALAELAASIAEIGIVQPITVRDMGDGTYILIAGERRWRASQMAGLTSIPAYIRTVDDEQMMEMALIENIQREDLNALEIALAYQNLMDRYNMTQEQLSARVGKNRSSVANYLRLLKLPAAVQMALKNREIDMGHARAILSVGDAKMQLKLYEAMRKEGSMSVRRVEELARELAEGGSVQIAGSRIQARQSAKNREGYEMLGQSLSRYFGVKVQLTCSESGRGKIVIPFANESEMEHIMETLDRIKD